jgi:carbonic anhydrase
LNVLEQARQVGKTTVVQNAWARGQPVAVHGWIYRLQDGLLHDLGVSADAPDAVDESYLRALTAVEKRLEGRDSLLHHSRDDSI